MQSVLRAAAPRAWLGSVTLALLSCDDASSSGARGTASAVAERDAPPQRSASAAPPPSASALPVRARASLPDEDLYPRTLDEQRAAMLGRMEVMLGLGKAEIDAVRALLQSSPVMGQGNPDIVEYAMTRKACREKREKAEVVDVDAPECGAPFMVPLPPDGGGPAAACIDRYEFPGVPCEHPVTWVSARDAALLCTAVGKRLCDAHEWEGGCAGAVRAVEAEYDFKVPRKESKHRHNADRPIVWAYGAEKDHGRCAMGSKKSDKCTESGWKKCGSNTYPAGAFPECRSPLGVYDQHGNVAEHMNLPLKPEQLASRGGMGETEMKGSWFIFQKYEAHTDDCRWRAPDWHGTKVMAHDSHLNYHLGFRCCKSIPETR